MYKYLFVTLLVAWCSPAFARMYQWVDPQSGTTQLSGKPPAWYRSGREGPRVFVFENGEIIDDTMQEVSEEQRDLLRQQAFIRAEEDKQAAREELLDAKRLKAALDQKQKSRGSIDEGIIEDTPEPEPESDQQVQPAEDETLEQMQDLIRRWEELQTENARKLIDSDKQNPAADASPDDLPPAN